MATSKSSRTAKTTKRSGATRTRRNSRAMAQENPTPSRTVKNGNGGNGKTNGEGKPASEIKPLTDEQREQLRAAKARKTAEARTTSLTELLTQRVMGVGKTTADKALAEADLKGTAQATREQLDRANRAAKDKAGLRGKALAMWVLTGDSNGSKAKETPAASTSTTTRARAEAKPKADPIGQDQLVKYLKETTSNAKDALAKALPTVDEDGKLRVKARHFQAWLSKQTKTDVSRPATTAVLKEAGLKSEQWSALPAGKRVVYAGDAPKGAGKLPVRKAEKS